MTPGNHLLSLLPPQDLDRFSARFEEVELKPRRILHHARSPIDNVYFVEEGAVSVLANVGGGKSVEVWFVGCEGLVGAPAVLGTPHSAHRRVVQIGGRAQRLSVADLRRTMAECSVFRDILLGYLNHVLFQASQSGACNTTHALPHRLARWLLLACAHQDSAELALTHDMLGRLLGVRRATITECLNAKQRDGLLQTSRGRIKILEAGRLEDIACPCYRLIRAHRDRFTRSFAALKSTGAPELDQVSLEPASLQQILASRD